jgi:hypothetical protein
VWRETDIEPAQAPEDWSGSVDIDSEDLPDHYAGNGWHDPMGFLDSYD